VGFGGGVKGGETIETIEGRGGWDWVRERGKTRERRRKNKREGGGEAERRSERERGAAGGYLLFVQSLGRFEPSQNIYRQSPAPPNTLHNSKQTSLPTNPSKTTPCHPSSLHAHTHLNHPPPDVLFSTPTLPADTVAALNRVSY